MSATKTRSKEAEHVFVLMTNEHRVSRNIRANWYFEHLNTCVSLKPKHRLCEFTEEVEIVSVVARDDGEADQQIDDTEEHTYLITANTKVTFLARRYRFVFILDLSPSVSSVDVLSNSVLYEKIFLTFSRSLRGLCSHAYVPGSKIIFEPEICVTVLAHTPFYTSEGQQVLAQGWKINSENVELLLSFVHQRLKEVTLSVAEVTASASEFNSNDTDIYISSLFEDIDARLDLNSAKTMTTPDVSIVNMFRYGLLALQLLPEQSNTGIVMITDGMFGLPNASVLEILLTQLRNNTIACSFLQIGSNPSPFSCIGYVPYTEIMKFLSTATFGAYLPHCPKIHQASVENKEFNLYHRAFLAWSFQRGVSGFQFDETFCKANEWFKDNPYFYYGKQKFDENNEMEMKENERVIFQAKDQQLIRHKQFQSEICAKFTDLLSCRLREGYTIKEVKFSKGEAQITVTLVLPFQYNCSMEYVISAAWTPNHKISENSELNELTECHYEITVESNYNFLHDVTCQVKKPIKSPYRNDAVRRYWSTLKSLSDSDKFLVHLNKFAQSAGATVPESIRSKIPLFYLPPNSSYPVLTSKTSQSAFAQYWKQICLLDVNMWQKWMHTHRIKLILQHDTPLPKYLHLPSANGRYAHIQCRQALQEVNTLLNNYSSFVMVENHSYIKLIQNVETDAPESFFIIRVITYLPLPYMVIYLAFVGGFSGAESQKIVDELKEMLKNCKFRKRNVKSQKSSLHISVSSDEKKASVDHDWVDVNACFLIRKPVEKILIKYERTPSNYLCSFDRQISSVQNNSERSLEQINMLTLSKYLHHHRWVWVSQQGPKSKLAATSMSKILSTLLKVRLQEGFKFAHNNNGIINVVSELRMEDNCPENTPCVVQYVLFPPHTNTVISDNCVDNEEMETVEADGEWQLITECWIEPQVGKVYGITECCDRFEQLTFHEITQSFFDVDEKIISTLLTYEHIALMCNNQSVPAFSPFVRSESAFRDCQMLPSNTSPIHDTHKGFPHKEINLTVVPFCFKIVNLLTKCQQAQVTFSTLISNVDFSANYDSSKNIANTKFIDEILTNLVKTNDREIYFTMEDNCSFLQFVREKLNENLFPLNDSDEFISSEGCPKWRCFAKALPSNQLVLTVIPSSFQDLIRLLTVSYSLSIDEIPEKSICYFDQSGDETIDMSENVRYCSLTFPVFVYKCGLSSLTKQLALNAYQKEEDLYIDCRHNELACEAIKKPRSFVPGQLDAGNICLNSICDAVSSTVWMSLTKVVFDTLQIGLSVDKRDIDFVLDSICEKTSIEIDIWPFLRSICGHLNDYCQGMYQFFEERNRTQNSQNQSGKPALSPSEKKFPLDLLKRHHPCDDLKQLHATIKKRFVNVLLQYVTPIKCKPSSFVFKSKPLKNVSDTNNSNLSISKTISNSTPNITDAAEIDSERKSTYRRVHRESTSLPCSLSSRSNSICEDEEDEDISSYCSNNDQKEVCFEYDSDASPLFLDIQCSVKCEGLEGHCTLESMPTCLGDVIPCLGDNQQNVDISHLNVSLSVICLTLNLNSESVFSVQPSTVPNEDASLLQTPETVLKSLPSFIQNEPEKDFMSHLPDFQKNVINNFMTKIQWMLQDEIVASYLKSYPISESILESVANHVQNSDLSTFCIREEIPLKFVQSQESSLEKFEAIFCRQELSGFQLKKEGKFYYLVYAEHKTKNSRGVRSSLIPPLNFLTQIESFHCVDSTELKQVCSENENANSCRKFSESRNASGDTYGLPATTLSIKRNVRSNSRLENEIDDSDNSDNSDVVAITSKKRLRKISKTREKSQSESRSASVPPSSPIEKNQEQRKPGQSAPAEMFDFLASIKSPKKVASPELTEEKPVENNEDIIDEELIDYSNPNPTVQSYAKRKLKDIIESSSSTTNFGSNAKEEFSEPEDAGYDPGDSSDSDGELNWQVRDNKQPILPSFWIILRINIDSVVIYFHTRHILDKSEGLDEAMNIWSELKQVICKNCRIVNQTVLLNHLHEYRMCNDLLVRNDELRVVKHERAYSFGLSAEFDNSISLDATKLYEPGSFECDEVWQIHFPLHPRLYSSNPRPSRGIQAVRSVLNSFSVNNRQNMFVYQDNSGNVFYLRLSEISCAGHGIDQELVQDVSKFSSSESLADNKSLNNFSGAVIEDFMSFRERVNSTASENYNTHETLSVASQNSSAMERLTLKGSDNQDCIVLHVYGIGEVGEDIKELMYDSLQKKLDEAVLDVLIVALTRNPHCKLTPKDVFFIQRPKKPPNLTTKYFITPKLLGFLHPIKIYLRQNLLNFLNNPKYTDTDSQNHFKAFSKMSSDVVVEDDDVFLLYRQQASGTSGSKGIACIILSIVDGNDNFVRSISSPPVRVNTHCDLPLVSDFEEEVECKVYNEEEENVKSPGPIAILRFQIWSTGKVDLEQLSNKLKDAVKCAFWDVVTEYRFLMVPLCDWNDMEESGSFSAPISPRKERRLGRILREDEKIKLLHQLEEIQTKESKEFFSSVPDMRGVKSNNLLPPLPLKQDSSMLFQLNNELNCPIVEDCKKEVKSHENISTTKIFGDYLNLVKIYRSSLRKWMDFGTKFGVPSVSIKEYKLMSRRSVVHFVKELFGYITTLSPTVCVKTYQCINEENETFKEILDLNDCCSNEVGVATEYIMILRNIELWKAFIGFHEQRKVYLESLFSSKSKSNQRMPPHICNFKSSSSEILGNPLSAVSHNSLTSYSQLDVKSCISIEEQNETPFVPRQKIFMILVEDKDVKLYIYNWSIDAIQSITNFAENLTEWQNSRTSVLYSFVAQKMGLFHNQPFQRKCPSVKHSNVQIQRRDTFSSFPSLDKLKAQKTHSCPTSEYTDLLIEHNSPTVAAVVNKKTTTAVETKKRRAGDISSFFRECVSADVNDSWSSIDDYVLRFGTQGKHLKRDVKDLQYLARLWHLYGTKPQIQILDKMMRRIQQVGRLQHFCATPLLFTSQWRQKVSLVRDHTLEPVTNDAKFMYFDENRSRHSSGNSCKGATESIATSRSRRLSGQPTNTNSFSVKMRNSFDDGWHIAVCTHYIQEYVQYLQTLGFVAVQLKNIQHTSSRSRSKDESDANTVNENGTGGSFYQKLGSRTGLSTNFLYKSLMGGLLVFEVGVVEPYVYSYLYSLEGKRLQSATMNSKIPLSQFVCSFLDEIDKVKVTMHLHSFTYDYHLRTIHSYISGRQLIFKQGYHLISFLEDFMKYYQKAPNFARNQIHAGELKMQNMNITADQLYNYITSHNEVYGMNVFRVVSFLNDQEVNQSTSPEYVLIQLSSQSVPYRDHLDARQLDNFDIALLICQNKNHCEPEKNSICLKYFVLLTSQREVYPKLCTSGIGAKLGCVRPIRLGTSLPPSRNPSRKNSSNTEPTNDVPNSNSFSSQSTKETSLNTSFSSNEPTLKHSSSKTLLNVKTIKSGMCDEDVCYLGYFSSHEEMMLQLLKEKADSAHQQLGEILSQAAVHCRRDHFWKSLNQDNVQLTYTQFNELLSLVVVKKITDFDSNLLSYSTLQFSFYQNVAKTLNSKYGVTNHKQFYSPDGKVIQHIYFNKASEGFMLLALDSEKQTAEAGLVFKECLMDIKAEDYASYDVQLIKDYLSACVHNKTNQQNKSKRFFFWKKS